MPGTKIGNEGAPFRCLSLHTHQKAPVEAQARFSEDPVQQFYRTWIRAAQPDTTGRPNTTRRTRLIYQVQTVNVNLILMLSSVLAKDATQLRHLSRSPYRKSDGVRPLVISLPSGVDIELKLHSDVVRPA